MKKENRNEKFWPAILYLFRVNRRYLPLLFILLFFTVVGPISEVVMGWMFKNMVDSTLAHDMTFFRQYSLILLGLLLGTLAFTAFGRLTGGKYANIARRNMREMMGYKLSHIPIPYLEKRRSGDLLSMLGNDLVQIGDFFENQFRMLIGEWVRFAFSLAYMIVLNPWLTLITVAFIPIGGIIMAITSKQVQQLTKEQNAAVGDVISLVQDSVSGQSEVKAFAMQKWFSGRFRVALEKWLKLILLSFNAQARIDTASVFNLVIPFGAMMTTGLWLALHGRITAGGLLAFTYMSNGIVNPIMALNWRIGEIRRAAGAANRLIELMEAEEERPDGEDLPITADAPLLSFDHVAFSYEREDAEGQSERQTIFTDLSFDIRQGETVAVVGQSGSGKSTILKLTAGFYEPTDGRVFFGGHALGSWNLAKLRAHLSMVDQDTYLFPGSIEDNVACGNGGNNPDGQEDVTKAVRAAHLEEFVLTLPDGMDTFVGERGARLSGGQRQRVAIARSMLSDAELLLLDEPTSALDSTTEKEIQRELETLMKGRTALIVTHRLSMAVMADRIMVLDGGKIVEQGTHSQLMELRGRYYALYMRQTEKGGGEAA